MARFRIGLVLVGALALTLSACGDSEKTLPNIDRAEQQIFELVNGAFGDQYTVDRARCPDEVPMDEGLTFICTVDINGKPLQVGVTQTNDEGAVRIRRAQAVLRPNEMEAAVAAFVTREGKPAQEVSCSDAEFLVRSAGTEISCSIVYPDGTRAVATLGVQDTKGTTPILKIRPPLPDQ